MARFTSSRFCSTFCKVFFLTSAAYVFLQFVSVESIAFWNFHRHIREAAETSLEMKGSRGVFPDEVKNALLSNFVHPKEFAKKHTANQDMKKCLLFF